MDLATTLNLVQQQLFRHALPPFIALGTLGNLFNLIIFLQPYLRSNPCSMYLTAYTIASFVWLDFIALTASLSIGYSFDIGTQSLTVCRFRTYIIYITINLLPDFLIMASFDRTCISCRQQSIRQCSTMKVAAYTISALVLFWLLFDIPAFFYTSIAQLPTGHRICSPLTGNTYNNFIFVFFAISYGVIPPIVLIVLGLITLTNVLRFIDDIAPMNELSRYRPSVKERQLILMLLSQVLVTVVCQCPASAFQVYSVATLLQEKTTDRLVIESFIYQLLVFVLFLPPCLSFYVYFLAAKTFRNEFGNVVRKVLKL